MKINIEGANEHNLKDVSVEIGDGLTVVTGISGSGKTSLVFDTLYHEARRRFQEIFSLGERMTPADVRSITGVGPAVAVGQNLLNRNPGSTLATASGLHPFLRLLYANFGERRCAHCGAPITVWSEDEIVDRLVTMTKAEPLMLLAPLVQGVYGSHRSLIALLRVVFSPEALIIDGIPLSDAHSPLELSPQDPHNVAVVVARFSEEQSASDIRHALQRAWALGANAIRASEMRETGTHEKTFSRSTVCSTCGTWFGDIKPVHFHRACPHCGGEGCARCGSTGLHPEAAAVRWHGYNLPELLALPVDDVYVVFNNTELPSTAARLSEEIMRRLDALRRVGLGYIALDRSSPTLSRGESQRVRLAVALTSRLEDILHILDEPTIGLHPADVGRLLSAFRDLAGPVVFVEHDRIAAAAADYAIDLGPGAGQAGGEIVFQGTPAALWQSDTFTGRYFSLRSRVNIPKGRPAPVKFFHLVGVYLRNLQHITISIPLERMTVITGVSGSGKSTFVEDVLATSLQAQKPVGCEALEGPVLKAVMVDQSPIGRNPRSNPATYTNLANYIRDVFGSATHLTPSHFSFNRPEGACSACKGIGAVEVKMRYLPSTWLPCAQCDGQRFSDEVLEATVDFDGQAMSIADFYNKSISEVAVLLKATPYLHGNKRRAALRILRALTDIGLGYLALGQPSPTLSGGEAQRVKLAKYLGKRSLQGEMLILDEPSTGLHPKDVGGLLTVFDRLVRSGATVVVVEHNTDIIRSADWVVDLGPGAGAAGGRLCYSGNVQDLIAAEDLKTAAALREEDHLLAGNISHDAAGMSMEPGLLRDGAGVISIFGARANNLKNVDVAFPKQRFTVVTGVSGSGKSSLVSNVLEAEARRRFLETLSLYERQGTREGPEAPVDEVRGLGVAVTVDSGGRGAFGRRNSVGTATEIQHHLAVLFALMGERDCPVCAVPMNRVTATRKIAETRRSAVWQCPSCAATYPVAAPRHFTPSVYAAACTTCHGVGTLRQPNPSKLIIHPEKPLCGGAMYSPGFFPKGYLCKPMNGGYEVVQAVAKHYHFDPATTPWNEMTLEAQQAFLFGHSGRLEVTHQSRNGSTSTHMWHYPGFYGWVRDWDVGGTYTDAVVCPDCHGVRLRQEYASVTLNGRTLHELSEMPLGDLAEVMDRVEANMTQVGIQLEQLESSLHTIRKRLHFLMQVGLRYLHLNRDSATLSAGEAQRLKLAGLLGSGLTSLTILVDEPSRGMHPSEIDALVTALQELRSEGNTVIVVEHDPTLIKGADYLIDVGPGAGIAGGEIVASGEPIQVLQTNTMTAQWLRGERRLAMLPGRRQPKSWLTIYGARAHNLRGEDVRLPLGVLVGICGVSGSGKSTLMIDTLGRALAPKKQTTSVAFMPVDPGEHDRIENAPTRTLLVDQVKSGVHSPAIFLDLVNTLHRLYAQSEDAQALGLDEKLLKRSCSVCGGSGNITIDMGFLPNVHAVCEACRGTGYLPEAWDVRVQGVSLPDLFGMTIDEVYAMHQDQPALARPLTAARNVGLGYLVLRQPGYALSGGEAQRLKIAKELCRITTAETLYILDEPTVGQHLEDVARLNGVLHQLVDAGNTVFVVEHHPHLLAACDWLIELGPGGGPDGGKIIATGTPEEVSQGTTPTAKYLREVLTRI